MYHPTRGGVRGGRDQFSWDDVKIDKHRENYLGHSVKAPVGRWQKGKDLNWYARDKKANEADLEAAKEEIKRIKEEEEQAMREALGLAPKRSDRPRGNRLDKHEYNELIKRGSTADDLGGGHAEAARVQGLGFARAPRSWTAESSTALPPATSREAPVLEEGSGAKTKRKSPKDDDDDASEDDRRKLRKEERKQEKRERKQRESDEKKKHKKEKRKRRHDSD